MRSSDETIKTDVDVPCHSKCGTIKKNLPTQSLLALEKA